MITVAIALAALIAVLAIVWHFAGVLGIVGLVLVAALILFGRWALLPQRKLAVNRVRYQRVRLALHLHPGKGHATLFQLFMRWGRVANYRRSKRIRRSLPWWLRLVQPNEHSMYMGKAHLGRRVRTSLEENLLILAPPRTGKSGTLSRLVLHAPGPVVSGSTRDDIFRLTAVVRSRSGKIHVFNPQRIGNVPSTFRWNPLEGCKDPVTAIRRADALMYGAMGGGQSKGGDSEWWAAKAAAAMRGLLHAAALEDQPFEVVAQWINIGHFASALTTLETAGATQLAAGLIELMGPAERTTHTVRMFMSRAVVFMSDPTLAEAVKPTNGDGLDIDEFVTGKNSLYLIGEGQGTDAPLAPLYVALTSEIQARAVQVGSQMAGGRLDPPCLLALDEATQTVPVPLPHWLADGAGKGIPCIVVAHGVSQLRSRYGDNGARAILDTAGTWLLLGGISDPDTLKMAETLSGQVAIREHGQDQHARHPILTADMIRELPSGYGVLLRGALAPVVIRLSMGWKDRAYKRVRNVNPAVLIARPVLAPVPQPKSAEGEAA